MKKTTIKKKAVKLPKIRDFVRVCDECNNRIVVSIRRHGYLTSLTVDINGYLCVLTDKKAKDLAPKNIHYLDIRYLLNKGIIARKLPGELLINQKLLKTFNPLNVKNIYCLDCHKRMAFNKFQELKHS